MSHLKYHIGKGSAYDVWKYCLFGNKQERKHGEKLRAAAIEYFNIFDTASPYKEMDEINGAQKGEHTSDNRNYYHWTISPDPKDFENLSPEEGLEKVKALAHAFVDKYAANRQVFIAYHDDAECGNIHAHVVFGSKDLGTNRRFHMDDKAYERMKDFVNKTSRGLGLSARLDMKEHLKEVAEEFVRLNEKRIQNKELEASAHDKSKTQTLQRTYRSEAERHGAKLKGQSWKEYIRKSVDEAVLYSQTFEELKARLAYTGVEVYQNRQGQCVYVVYGKDGKVRGKIKGERLGKFYQSDFLATQYMDLRFTKAYWNTNKKSYIYLKDLKIHLPMFDKQALIDADTTYQHFKVVTDDEAQAQLTIMSSQMGELRTEIEHYESEARRYRRLESDLAYVNSLSISDRRSNSEYERARKRLVRANIDFKSNPDTLSLKVTELDAKKSKLEMRLNAVESKYEGLREAYLIKRQTDVYIKEMCSQETERYGSKRIAASIDEACIGVERLERELSYLDIFNESIWKTKKTQRRKAKKRRYRKRSNFIRQRRQNKPNFKSFKKLSSERKRDDLQR